ncbi:hypothetical protein Pmani_001251 [Petrolisthes manimaculis]|uniref:Fanconi-associated nuclease n=1 Tax=Petrolisthes manimaculis TaxID=1843537 RepID=A0AAE1US73_9EUCA|nr:hypothetical protein Pmani_001251 [Petrolisthes manimaculis]
MKKVERSKPGSSSAQSSGQKTLFHYFGKKASTNTPLEKVLCPACSLLIPKSKINLHLDHDCKSNVKNKENGKSCTSKKVTRKDSKAKKRAVLSDSEDDFQDISLLDEKNESFDICDSDNDTFYLSSSMVEVVLSDESTDAIVQPSSQKENASPYFSPNAKEIQKTPGKRKEKVIVYDSPNHNRSAISTLMSDWSSPEKVAKESPEKVAKEPQTKLTDSPAISSCTYSPHTKSGKAVKAMLDEDWNTSTPNKSSKKFLKTNLEDETEDFAEDSFIPSIPKTPSSKRESPKKLLMTDLKEKAKDFAENSFIHRTPKTPSPKKSSSQAFSCQKTEGCKNETKVRLPLSLSSSIENSPDEVSIVTSKNSLQQRKETCIDNQILKKMTSPENISDNGDIRAHELSPGSDSTGTELFTPELVTPVRSPSPDTTLSPPKENSVHVKRLFPTDPPAFDSKTNNECLPNISLGLQPSDKKLPKSIPQGPCSQDDIFNVLCQSSSQVKRPYRSPRKFHQGLKKTGLLEHSSQNLSKITPKKKNRSISPGSLSTPEKLDGSQQSPSKPIEEGDQQRYDKIKYRQYKGYYLENFLRILDTVMAEPQDVKLFNDEDLSVISTFHGLTLSAQKLYVRLFQRKIKWNKVSKIEYKDICDAEDTQLYVNELNYADLLHTEEKLRELNEVLPLMSNEDLSKLCKQMKLPSSGKKDDLASALLKFSIQQRTIKSAFVKNSTATSPILKKAKEMLGSCCLVDRVKRQVFMRMLLLYGLPRHDDDEEGGQQSQLTTLLMVNMGKMKFPQYETKRNHAIFRSRDDLLSYEEVSQLQTEIQENMEGHKWETAMEQCEAARDTYYQLISNKELMEHDISLPRFLRRFTSLSLLVYIMTCGVECCQRLKNYQRAVELLQELLGQTTHLQDYRGRWYDRLALNLQSHLRNPVLAVKEIGKALKDTEVRHGHRLSLSQRAQRLAASTRYKSLAPKIEKMALMEPREAPKVIIEGRSLLGDMPGYRRMFIRQDSARHAGEGDVTVCSVEELSLGHYKIQGYTEGLHREGTTINSLFGLLFWDVLYAPVPDVFRSPYQAAPLDLDDAHFYTARKELIVKRLGELHTWSEEECGDELTRVWTDHAGEVSLVAWDLFRNLEHLKGLVFSLGLTLIAAVCERLARDHRFTRSGFPDLIVWNPISKKYRIVEVKGPNDRLSTKQILWLNYLLAHSAVAEVCHVEAIGAKKIKRATPRKISPKKVSPGKSPKKSKAQLVEEDSESEFQDKSPERKKITRGGTKSKKQQTPGEKSDVKKQRKKRKRRTSSPDTTSEDNDWNDKEMATTMKRVTKKKK